MKSINKVILIGHLGGKPENQHHGNVFPNNITTQLPTRSSAWHHH